MDRLYKDGFTSKKEIENMTAKESWQKIIASLSETPGDFKTVPRIQRKPLWFYASVEGDYIYIDNARKANPSCHLSTKRKISYTDFETVYAYYSRWDAGEVGVRNEVR